MTGTAQAAGQQVTPQPYTDKPAFHQYLMVDEYNLDQVSNKRPSNATVMAFSPEVLSETFVSAAKTMVVNLMKWTVFNEDLPVPAEKYMRKLHFGRWINDPTDETCMNTRAKVLVRDSQGDVTYRNGKTCVVEDGKWQDPYTDTSLTSSRQIQIDHMVPLKNAYMSGAFNWDYKMRCLYANYMGFRPHLVSAEAHQNMSKGDGGPEKYLPPNEGFRCQYIRNWLAVKMIWRLALNPDEAQAIKTAVTQYGCNPADFRFTKADMDAQRQYIVQNINFCVINQR
ncbi:MAG: HNH endonuclease [Bdellovibrio sp.]|nr:HNH endonuclease [Bdellovibrio sp.]